MARRKTLEKLRKGLRVKLGEALDPNHNAETQEIYAETLNDVESELWVDNDWDHLKVYRYIAVKQGSRYYDFPADLDVDRTYQWEYKFNTIYYPMDFGIDHNELTAIDSDRGQQSDPLRKYDFHFDDATDEDQFEVWPTPANNGNIYASSGLNPVQETYVPNRNPDGNNFIRIRGIKKLNEMTENADRCSLDATLIELGAAVALMPSDNPRFGKLNQRYEQYKMNIIGNLKKVMPIKMGTDRPSDPYSERRFLKNQKFAYGPGTVI